MTLPNKTSRIPEFKTYAEEAAFWDTHDFTAFQDELKPIKVQFSKNLARGITVRFDRETLHNLRAKAAEKGIGATTLIRMWVLERLKAGQVQKL